jgi:putative colanic acid biosynthesis acetyltransferase WcaF
MSMLKASISKPTIGGPTYKLKHRIFRLAWQLVWIVLASWTPPPMHRWRVLLLNLFGAQVHYTAHVYGSAKIWYPPNLVMGKHSCLGPRAICYCMAKITLNDGAIVSQGAHLCTGMHDIEDPYFQLLVKPIYIEGDAWIAAEAFVGPGVTVADGAVIGARAVLFRDAEENGVYAGNPAQLIRHRIRKIQ